jgi:hypothetical protein
LSALIGNKIDLS